MKKRIDLSKMDDVISEAETLAASLCFQTNKTGEPIPRYHVLSNGQTVELTNSFSRADDAYKKARGRHVIMLKMTGDDSVIEKQKFQPAGAIGVCGGLEMWKVYKSQGFEAWQKKFYTRKSTKQNEKKAA